VAVILAKKPLPGGVSFTQDMQDRFVYSNPVGFVSGEIHSDKAGTLYLEESDDAGTTWTQTDTTTVSAGTTTSLPWTKLTKRWFRFRYKNGAASQGSFILLQQVEGMGFALPSSSGALTTQLTGSNAQLSSVKETNSATAVKTYTAATGATKMTVYCESGSIRIRSDGQPCTATTGAPLGEGWAQDFNVPSISIYFVEQSVISVVSE
jgi:hypothetical protein